MKCADCGETIDARQQRLHKSGGQCQGFQARNIYLRAEQNKKDHDYFKQKALALAQRLMIGGDAEGVANDIAAAETPAMAAVMAIEVVRLAQQHDSSLHSKHHDMINILLKRALVLR